MSKTGIDYWEFFVAEAQRNGAPLYEQFASNIARDDRLRTLASLVQPGQPPGNVLFAAVHYLLLRGAEHPLHTFYATLTDTPRNPASAFPIFRDFVETHRELVRQLICARVTNTNEVGRSAILHAGFRQLAKDEGEPLHLIELGPSAGLNLVWDRYAVRYVKNGDAMIAGDAGARLVLECEWRGERPPPGGRTPAVASRTGLERNPVDLSRRDERDWLKALVWPDHRARFERLERALAIIGGERLPIRDGDALARLPEAMSEVPAHQPVCVYHTFVTYQFSEEESTALDDLLIAASVRRPVWRLGFEGTLSGDAPLLLYHYLDGRREKRLLALCQPHGAWIDWRA